MAPLSNQQTEATVVEEVNLEVEEGDVLKARTISQIEEDVVEVERIVGEDIRKGAFIEKRHVDRETISQHESAIISRLSYDTVAEATLANETHRYRKWRLPGALYLLVLLCSAAAISQGMDESVNNSAIAFYPAALGILSTEEGGSYSPDMKAKILGLIVGAPYLACALAGCWLTYPLNAYFGRRGAIAVASGVCIVASLWQAFTHSWVNLFCARLVLGLGIGANSATVPVYAAETAPPAVRGGLVMMWQMWTAFGIMIGNVIGVGFGNLQPDLAWRLILGSTVVPPVLICLGIYLCPESPAWYIEKGKTLQAYESMRALRRTKLEADRDFFKSHVHHKLLSSSATAQTNFFQKVGLLFSVPRNRRAAIACGLVMFLQQFCGVNVIAYYSTTIFEQSGFKTRDALLVSMGVGIVNWLFALPAALTIDSFGRRKLLLWTLPALALCLFWVGGSFWIEDSKARLGSVAAGIFAFMVFYSPGMGPVPFTYSAEVFPAQVREVGMAYATAITWGFNFILAFSWPQLLRAFTPQGAFMFYGGWCMAGFFLVTLIVRETKELSLEGIDAVFSVPTVKFAAGLLPTFPAWLGFLNVARKRDRKDAEMGHGGVVVSSGGALATIAEEEELMDWPTEEPVEGSMEAPVETVVEAPQERS